MAAYERTGKQAFVSSFVSIGINLGFVFILEHMKIKKTIQLYVKKERDKQYPSLIRDFIRCGIAGWCLEVIFTSAGSLLRHDFSMTAHTSFLMFPIYGMGALLAPIADTIDHWVDEPYRQIVDWNERSVWPKYVRHGLFFMVLIFAVEYASGLLLRHMGICPWDYTGCPTNIDGLIRLDFAPFWFATGLLMEKITRKAPEQTL